ncbi:MAG: PEP-CTERM sorting domain-containing protein [Phycisphaerae bacterium]|nr:PEP-CTERM sorting domain-containing protein [Phycisphaerae bacterium]MDP7287423.1 PEP-CTERM sorting domain-containing protein [Phycisphaerae bacterium]
MKDGRCTLAEDRHIRRLYSEKHRLPIAVAAVLIAALHACCIHALAPTPTPEPATLFLLGAAVPLMLRRKRTV